jgi:hypothetical protein
MKETLFTPKKIESLLKELETELKEQNIIGEICLYGGAVMCLVYQARPATKDVDAIFEPTKKIRESIEKIAINHSLRADWLNDALKGFLVEHSRKIIYDWEYLKVYVPETDYLLAMKCLSSRLDTFDKEDILFLIKKLNLKTPEEVYKIIEFYYPKNRIKPATQFLLEEIFEL